MSKVVDRLAGQVKSLSEAERDEFLSWLADYELEHSDDWDREIEKDSQAGGRLESVLDRVRADIASDKTKPLDEVIGNS